MLLSPVRTIHETIVAMSLTATSGHSSLNRSSLMTPLARDNLATLFPLRDLTRTAMDAVHRRIRGPRSLRFQLLFGVNAVLSVLLALALGFDYYRDLHRNVKLRRLALEEEAKAIAAAIPALQQSDSSDIQRLIERFCGSIDHKSSPGHHIVVQWNGEILQPLGHGQASDQLAAFIVKTGASSRRPVILQDEDRVTAMVAIDHGMVYVSEQVAQILEQVRRSGLWRLAGLLAAGVLAAVVVNGVLVKALIQPIERLTGTVREIARGHLGLQAGTFQTLEVAALASDINHMSTALAEHDRERKQQIEKARRLQEHLFADWPALPGVTALRHFTAATEVTGDYHDAIRLNDTEWLLCLADVTGHGVPAAMGAAMLKTLFWQAATEDSTPHGVLQALNARFARVVLPGDFASMLVLHWNVQTRRLSFANAGHPAGLILRVNDSPVPIASTGPLLGVLPDATWNVHSVSLRAGDRVAIFSDGLTEAFNDAREMLGSSRVLQSLQSSLHLPLDAALQRLCQRLDDHQQAQPLADDVTIILLEFHIDCGLA